MMSYSFGMFFVNVENKSDAFNKAIEFVNACWEDKLQIIDDAKYSIPTLRGRNKDNDDIDRYWLYKLFSFNFVYWEKYKMLGISGYRYPEKAKDVFDWHISFQNSCDQDYHYAVWGEIFPLFNKIVEDVKKASIEEVISIMNTKYEDAEYEKEINENNLEFYRKSAIYQKIYTTLDLNEWLWDRPSELFERFSLLAINSEEKEYEAFLSLMEIKKKYK